MNLRIASCSLAVSTAFAAIPLSAFAAPTVSFVAPAAGGTLSGSISASSACEVRGSNIDLVRFYLDSTSLNTEGSAPWTCNIDTRNFSNGTHTLRAVAYDSSGSSSSAQISVNVQNGTSAGVYFKAPAANATLSGNVQAAACEAAGTGLSKVQFYLDGTALNTEAAAPYNCHVDTTKFADGAHTLKAVGTYTDGRTGSTQIAVNIKNSTATPAPSPTGVYFKTPAANATLSGNVQAAACEAAGTGLSKVQFYLDGTALNTEAAAPYNCHLDTTKFADGAHALKAVGTFSDGRTGSTQIAVNIKNTTSTPTPSPYGVYFKAPAANATLSGNVEAAACEAAGTGVSKVQFYLDGIALNTEGAAPWNCHLDTTKFANGAHALKAVATYTDGKTGSAQIAVNIKNSTSTPTPPDLAACANPSGGYEGFGRNTTGGAGKSVYRVTNTKDSGSGSLRDALSQGNRCVVFDVGGTITLAGNVLVKGANVTIDGLTAPSPGITLKNGTLVMQGSSGAGNIVVRGIRSRGAPSGADSIRVYNASNIVIDRVSVSGYGDGGIDVTEGARNVTIQWSIVGRGNTSSHNFANLIAYGANRITVHHNLYINADDRHPYCGVSDSASSLPSEVVCDVRNNVIWEYLTGTTLQDYGKANVVNNYYYSSRARSEAHSIWNDGTASTYISGNHNRNGWYINGTTRSTPFAADPIASTDAVTAARSVKAKAGARSSRFGLDSTDQGYVGQVTID